MTSRSLMPVHTSMPFGNPNDNFAPADACRPPVGHRLSHPGRAAHVASASPTHGPARAAETHRRRERQRPLADSPSSHPHRAVQDPSQGASPGLASSRMATFFTWLSSTSEVRGRSRMASGMVGVDARRGVPGADRIHDPRRERPTIRTRRSKRPPAADHARRGGGNSQHQPPGSTRSHCSRPRLLVTLHSAASKLRDELQCALSGLGWRIKLTLPSGRFFRGSRTQS